MRKLKMSIKEILFKVTKLRPCNEFYGNALGFAVEQSETNSATTFAPTDNVDHAKLRFEIDNTLSNYRSSSHDVYWKVGLTMPDVRLGRKFLMDKAGVHISQPKQFRDIGYLCHTTDPNGLSLELLQFDFESNYKPYEAKLEKPMHQPVGVGQLTLRINNIEENLLFYRDCLGMKLLSIQKVDSNGFTLYFFGPEPLEGGESLDLESVALREPLWRYPFTSLELLHSLAESTEKFDDTCNKVGFKKVVIEVTNLDAVVERLANAKYVFDKVTMMVKDPNNVPVQLVQAIRTLS